MLCDRKLAIPFIDCLDDVPGSFCCACFTQCLFRDLSKLVILAEEFPIELGDFPGSVGILFQFIESLLLC